MSEESIENMGNKKDTDKLTFVTLFPSAENVHLMKDVGMIPFVLASNYQYKSRIVSLKNGEYPYLEKYLYPMEQYFLKRDRLMPELSFIWRYATKIDVLNMYHISIHHSMLCMIIYKFRNPKGVTYLKTDLDFRGLQSLENYRGIKRALTHIMLKNVDIVSSETHVISQRLENIFHREILYIPNGIYEFNKLHFEGKSHIKRENVFLTVGRLGTEQKNTELLVRAFLKIYEKCDWNLLLVGSIEQKMKDELELLYTNNPALKQRIIYHGELTDKSKLNAIYQTAKCFVLPSRWEGFGLVILEAAQNGDYLILSEEIPVAHEFVTSENIGQIVPLDENILAEAMLKVTSREIMHEEIKTAVGKNYQWTEICRILDQEIRKKRLKKRK